jgi:hypothetical protein
MRHADFGHETGDNWKMRRVAIAIAVAIGAGAAPASADVLKLFAEGQAGGMYGFGTAGAQKDNAFFKVSPHTGYGLLIGAQIFFFDALIQHQQLTNFTDHLATWTSFGIGVRTQSDTGNDQQKKEHKGGYYEFSGALWFGLGTGQQVMPPLNNAQVSDKGFYVEGRVGFGTHLSSVFDLGVEIPVSWGYFYKNLQGAANDLDTHYHAVNLEGLVYFRATLSPF